MNWLSLIPLVLNFLGGQQAASAANQAAAAGQRGLDLLQSLIDYNLTKRKTVYDPIETGLVLPGLQARAQQGPFYANEWLGQARRLRKPMALAPLLY